MASLLAQLRQQTDYLAQCRGAGLLATFTEMAALHRNPTMEELVLGAMHDYRIPIPVSRDLGYGADCLPIGAPVSFQ